MDLQNLINAIIPYGLPSLLIGITVGAIFFAADKIVAKKDKTVEAYLPLITGFCAYFIYALTFMPIKEVFSEGSYSSSLICGSLSAGVFVFIKNLKNGNGNGGALFNFLSCYTDEKKAKSLSVKIVKIFAENLTETEIAEKILSLLSAEKINDPTAKSITENLIKNFFDSNSDKEKR